MAEELEPAAADDDAADVADTAPQVPAPPVEDVPDTAEPDAEPISDPDVPAAETPSPEPAPAPAPAPEPARPTPRKKGRPSVPSWDDVVFGAKPRD